MILLKKGQYLAPSKDCILFSDDWITNDEGTATKIVYVNGGTRNTTSNMNIGIWSSGFVSKK